MELHLGIGVAEVLHSLMDVGMVFDDLKYDIGIDILAGLGGRLGK